MIKRNIGILGSTGSIGTQALEVIRENPERFKVSVLTAQSNAELLVQQAVEFRPARVVICEEKHFSYVYEKLSPAGIEVLSGEGSLLDVVTDANTDMILSALVGFAGLQPTIAAIKSGKDIALANKETLAVAGELVMGLAKQYRVKLLPVDSEHSAIFQCLIGEENNPIEKIYLTASGGPFRGKNADFLSKITKNDALKHPNWVMGTKITIDSATLMNKGLEVIEAKWLFDLNISQIDVIIHPQSVIHSIVQFTDGSMKAQMGLPDMKLPIQYALGYPERIPNNFPRFNFPDYTTLSFEKPDTDTFKNLALAYQALEEGGNMPCIINAANEVVVDEFLNNRVGFLQMSDIIRQCMKEVSYVSSPGLSDYMETDFETRIFARKLVTNR